MIGLLLIAALSAGPEALEKSVHAVLDCTDCHTESFEKADCGTCHDDEVTALARSVHGGIAGCTDCHGDAHAITPIEPSRLADICGACHADSGKGQSVSFHLVRPIEAYRSSVHGRAVQKGEKGADCGSCHGTHDILPASDPDSRVNHRKVPDTCGSCHTEIAKVYRKSIHGQAEALGVREAPVCTDCHGEHRILSPSEASSFVSATNIPKMTCGRCHGDLRLGEKYGISTDVLPAYEDSYHGLAARAGRPTVARCASCHGVHDILPSSDPASHVNPNNLPRTCGKCHPGAGTTFAIGPVHVIPTEPKNRAVYLVRLAYLWIIWIVVGGMILHNLLDFLRKLRARPVAPTLPPRAPVERMRAGFRIAHGLTAVSFVVLVYSGFALTYPERWWARPLASTGFDLRGIVHRTAAVLMLVALLFHAVHLALDRRARACIARMRPGLPDLVELRQRIDYFLGRREHPPTTGVLGYPEKMEYLALIWGMVVMTITGFVLWFENPVLRYLPKWVSDLATTIHFYEAVLAGLAILFWHLYFVVFDPVVYPMDPAWLTGRAPAAREMEREPVEQ